MLSRLIKKNDTPDPIDSLIADAELRLHDAEFDTYEYRKITRSIIDLRELKMKNQTQSNTAMAAEIGAVLTFVLFALKPELAQRYSKMYWDWKLFNMFNWR